MKKYANLIKNTGFLYLMTFAKLVLPLITLPYLTRVLTTECYGVVTYVKAVMSYMQLFIDFGFVLSATKDVVTELEKNDMKALGIVVGDTIAAKGILAIAAAAVLAVMTIAIPILRENALFTWLYFVSIMLTIFLTDFLFRGMEKMELVTLPYVVTKLITTVLTVIFVKGDQTFMYISVFEIIGTVAAVLIVAYISAKMNIKIRCSNIKNWLKKIAESFVYFASNIATTAFSALNTIVVGMYLGVTEVAYWGLCMQLVGSVNNMYTPITNSLYPHMIHTKSRGMIRKVLFIFVPVVFLGCVFCLLCGEWIMVIVGGSQYLPAAGVFKMLVPTLFFGFLSILFGWPVLGAIGKEKETTFSTVSAAVVQVVLLIVLGISNHFTLTNVAVSRCVSEVILFGIRYYFYRRNISLFLP